MPFHIVKDSIITMTSDVMVNSTSREGNAFGGAEKALFDAGGPSLIEARKNLGAIQTGEVLVTKAFDLKASYVFHTVVPKTKNQNLYTFNILRDIYYKALRLAVELDQSSIAFPLIGSGYASIPKAKAYKIAIESIKSFLKDHELDVYLVLYDKNEIEIDRRLKENLSRYIHQETRVHVHLTQALYKETRSLEDLIKEKDQTFSETLLRLIDERQEEDVTIYKRANLSRKHFSKIRSNKDYQPSKNTAMALGIALRLNLDEFNDLLEKAGYTLSSSYVMDMIVQYFIEKEIYDLYEINATLFEFIQKTL